MANAKNTIVVKSVIVPAANLISNMFQLLNRGVPLRHILAGVPKKTAEINGYVKMRHREISLEADLRAATAKQDLRAMRRIKNEMDSIKDSYKRMSIWPLIEAGEFSATSNGQVTAEDFALVDGKWTNWVERKLPSCPRACVPRDVTRWSPGTRRCSRVWLVPSSMATSSPRRSSTTMVKRQKKSHEEALDGLIETFVNYNFLAGRDRQYLESIGLLWFWNYKIRIMKEAAYMLRHNPLRSLLMSAVPVGTPIETTSDRWRLTETLAWSMGIDMGLNSFRSTRGLTDFVEVRLVSQAS